MRTASLVVVIIALNSAGAEEMPPQTSELRAAVDRSLAFLVKDALAWKNEHHCASCHHASLVVWAMREAKRRGYLVDESVMADLTKWMATSGNGKFGLARPASAPQAASPKAIYFALALGTDPQPDATVQQGLKILLATVEEEQTERGFWSAWPGSRPPIFGKSDESLTALATLAIFPAAAAGDMEAKTAREKGVAWLAATKSDDDPQSIALRLVLWKKLNRPAEECEPLVQRIMNRQNSDGGWSQSLEMASDAWATGQALYALAHADVHPNEITLTRGQGFLIKTQRSDGSWPMTSRPTAPGGKGSTNPIPIAGAGSAWAVLGLARSSLSPDP